MEQKIYTIQEEREIETKVEHLIYNHDKFALRELCEQEPHALYYFVNRAMGAINAIDQIRNIVN